MMSDQNRIFGIDLGTTYSCISYVDESGRPVVVRDEESDVVIASVVYFESESNIVVGKFAKASAVADPEHTVELIKGQMGKHTADGESIWEREFFGNSYKPESISAIILDKLAKIAALETGAEVTDVVITTPAYFNASQRTATENAGKIAGFNVRAIIPEPTAAAIAYSQSSAFDETLLVYDLGGGTFDIAVIDIKQDKIEVICTDGDDALGGRLWDDALLGHFVSEWQQENATDEDPLEDNETKQSFSTLTESAKRSLTLRETTTPITLNHAGKEARFTVTRDTFDQLTEPLLARTVDLTKKVLERAKSLTSREITKVLMVGGSSYMPQVRLMLEKEFNLTCELFDPDQSVAKGAAIYAANKQIQDQWVETVRNLFPEKDADELDEEQKGKVLEDVINVLPPGLSRQDVLKVLETTTVDVCTKTFGIVALDENRNSMIYNLIKKDSKVPAQTEDTFGTTEDNQSSVLIQIIESNGDNLPDIEPMPLPPHAREIGSANLPMPPGLPIGSPIMVRYFLSEDGGRLRVEAEDVSEHGKIEVDVSLTGAMTTQEIEDQKQLIEMGNP